MTAMAAAYGSPAVSRCSSANSGLVIIDVMTWWLTSREGSISARSRTWGRDLVGGQEHVAQKVRRVVVRVVQLLGELAQPGRACSYMSRHAMVSKRSATTADVALRERRGRAEPSHFPARPARSFELVQGPAHVLGPLLLSGWSGAQTRPRPGPR